jgi:hypothetical protein
MALTDPSAGNDLYLVRLTGVELIAAFARQARRGAAAAAAVRARRDFRLDWQRQYQVIEVTVPIIDRAMLLAERHSLRGYDAVHLASALAVADAYRVVGGSFPTLVSADVELLNAGAAEGLATDDPNSYA